MGMGREDEKPVVYRHGEAVQQHINFLRTFTDIPGVRAAGSDLHLESGAGWVVSRLALVLDPRFSRRPGAETARSGDPFVKEFAGIKVERLDKATDLTGWNFIGRR